MLTPKQTQLLNHPNVQLLINSLNCEPTLSSEFKYSIMVQDRVSNLIKTFEKALSLPVVARTVLKVDDSISPFKINDCSACIEVEHTLKAWKTSQGKKIMCPF